MRKYSLLAGVSALALIVAGCDTAPESVNNTVVVEQPAEVEVRAANDTNANDETPVDVNTL